MSKTFQEIEISNGSWIKEQSDQINIFNDIKLIDSSEDTFRLFDAMIFISYYASPLMHALNFLKQSLEYREYWERSIDYAIADINLKEYNFKAKDGIATFILLWDIVSNKSFEFNEFKDKLIAKIIDMVYDSEIDLNINSLNNLNVLSSLGFNHSGLVGSSIKENNLVKISNKVNKIKTKSIDYNSYQSIKILSMKFSPIEHPKNMLNLIGASFKLKYKFSNLGYKFTNSAKRYTIVKFNFYSLSCAEYLKLDYGDWFKRELRNWLKANLVFIKIFDNSTEKFSDNNIIYENFEPDKVDIKFGISYKNSNKFQSIFNIVLLDIYKNIGDNNSKNYILKINLINEVFNSNKNKLKNIFKNQKNPRKNNLCKIFCSFRIYKIYLYCPTI